MVDPDLAVVRGAAVQAGILDNSSAEKDIVITDVARTPSVYPCSILWAVFP